MRLNTSASRPCARLQSQSQSLITAKKFVQNPNVKANVDFKASIPNLRCHFFGAVAEKEINKLSLPFFFFFFENGFYERKCTVNNITLQFRIFVFVVCTTYEL